MSALLGMLAVSVVSSIISAAISASTAYRNMDTQKEINAENVQAQKDINLQNVEAQKLINQQNIDYSKEYAQNQIQWKMADLEAAGLNPTLAAGMSSGTYSPTALSAPTQKAPIQQAPMLDMNGVSSAINAMSNMMMTSYILNNRNQNYSDRTDALKEHWNNYKASNAKFVGNAKQVNNVTGSAEWDKIMKELDKMPYKFDWRK